MPAAAESAPAASTMAAPAASAPVTRSATAATAGKDGAAPANDGSIRNCADKLCYSQIYTSLDMPKADDWASYLRGLNARVPRTENVTETAARNNRPAPRPIGAVTLIYHPPDELACAQDLQEKRKDIVIRKLGSGFTGRPGVLELWIPPAR